YDLLIAIGLVALVMLVSLHSLRNALIVMLAIPTSLVFSLIGMYVMDFSLNLMTLLAMSLVIGVLVDDSIVVLENIYRHLEMGKDKARAALEGRNEIGFSAISITLVDVVVFFPLAFVPGITGGLVKEFALVIVVSTLASLLVCFTLTPMLASRFARLEHLRPTHLFNRFIIAIERQIQQLTQGYVALLKKALKYRWVVYALSVSALVSSLSLVSDGYVGGEFIPATDKGEITVTIELPAGTKITETNQMAKKIETQLAKMPEVSRLFSTVGLANDAFFGEIIGENQIEIAVLLQDKTKRQASIAQMSQRIRNLILQEPGAKVKVSPVGLIGAEATPVQILISGADRVAIQQYGLQLQQLTKQIKGTDDVRLSTQSGKPELAIQVDRAQLAKLGLSLEAVTLALRIAITGNDELKIKQLQTEVPLRIQLESADRQSKDQLENLSLVNDKGAVVYLKQFASFEYTTATSALERRNKQPALVLFSKVIGKDVNAIGDEIKQIVAQNPPPAGVKISYEGDLEMADDSFLYLALALLAGITLVYLIMTALYNSFYYPFVVLFSIPVALTGALLALALTMKTLNVFSIFGVIMMLGLVAKNAILLVDRTNELKAQGRSVFYALMDAGQTRLRPILMTTLAMVIGMLPLAMQQGAGGEYNSALAWVLIGGLTSSMCFTVFLVPAIYLEFELFSNLLTKRKLRPVGKVAALGILLGLLNLTSAQAQTKLGLADVEVYIKNQNPEVRIAAYNQQSAEMGVRQVRSAMLPRLDLNASYNRNIRPQVFFLPATFFDPTANPNTFTSVNASAKNVYQSSLNFSMPLFQAENRPNLSQASVQSQQAAAGTQQVVLQKTAEARKAYLDALWAKAQASFWEESQLRQQRLLAEMRQRLQQGLLTEADTLQAFAQAENINPQLVRVQQAYALAEQQLRLLLDLPDTATIELTDLLRLPVVAQSQSPVFENRPDLVQLKLQNEALFFQEKADQARRMPNLQLVAQYTWLSQDENFDFNRYRWINTYFVGLQLNIPIFGGFANTSRVQQTRIRQQQNQESYQFALKQAQTEWQRLRGNLTEISAQITSQEKVVQAANRAYQAVFDRWKQGLTKQTDLRQAELVLQESKLNYLGFIYQYLVLDNELKRVQGEL
ncbi:MAG TPA: hypothetical protein DCM08_13905, partial [Microscillaceae bacterium]|nr:hypothetical protein [Microscillaceae bacterium]